jgi:hypothetical protein
VSTAGLAPYLNRPLTPPAAGVMRALERPMSPGDALVLADVDRLLDPAPMAVENGWCTLPDGVGYVAVRTEMPGVTGEMVDWWFDWHPRDPDRYRAWHPLAHRGNSIEEPAVSGARRHWGAVHHPVEVLGNRTVHARIEFLPPTRMGMASDCLNDPRVASIVCGLVYDDRLRMRHSRMVHVFLGSDDGVVLRSRFWLGSVLRPDGPLGAAGERLLNHAPLRRRIIPSSTPHHLAVHCAEEFTNLASLLPELHERFGGPARG